MLSPVTSEEPPVTVMVEVVAVAKASTETSVVPKVSSTVSPADTSDPLIFSEAKEVFVFGAATMTLKP